MRLGLIGAGNLGRALARGPGDAVLVADADGGARTRANDPWSVR